MSHHNFDDLEMQLRILGRQLGDDPPSPALVQRTTEVATAHLAQCTSLTGRRGLMTGTLLLFAATLPIPMLFLWGEWAATSALFSSFLSPAASEMAASVYLWVKVCTLCLVYLIAVPAVALWAMRLNGLATPPPEMREA